MKQRNQGLLLNSNADHLINPLLFIFNCCAILWPDNLRKSAGAEGKICSRCLPPYQPILLGSRSGCRLAGLALGLIPASGAPAPRPGL